VGDELFIILLFDVLTASRSQNFHVVIIIAVLLSTVTIFIDDVRCLHI
jgi:hypothetical protein